ncbi:tyrosine-type recombinase/integrase [Streptomyces sp. NPDC001661]
MNAPVPRGKASSPVTALPWVARHCPEAEYDRFVEAMPVGIDARRKQHRFHVRFRETFPDLQLWFAQPLRVRLGWRNGEHQSRRLAPTPDIDQTAAWINVNARQYLSYLALTGRLRMDFGWLLGVGRLKPFFTADVLGLPLREHTAQLQQRVITLGLGPDREGFRIPWGLIRLVMHRGDPDLTTITSDDVDELRHTIRNCERIPQLTQVIGEDRFATLKLAWTTNAYRTGLALYHAGITATPPPRAEARPLPGLCSKQRIDAAFERFLAERALVLRPESMSSLRGGLRRFGLWLDIERPHVDSLAQLCRADAVDFMESVHRLHKIKHPDQPLSRAYRAGIISTVAVFFRHAAIGEWKDMPTRPLITHADMPRVIERVPRFIPDDQLGPVMDRVRAVDCPLQRCALLVARWSGARRTEIRKLHLDCLDAYPDGTPRLRLAAGKALKERTVPLHEEAADAIRALVQRRHGEDDRGIHDPDMGHPVRYLFLRNGHLAGPDYLFAKPLAQICTELSIFNGEGKPAINLHRFRHTLGTQLAERGARMQTIMKVLGHKSAGMSMTYTHLSDPTVLADYQAVLEPGAVIAGPLADTLRSGQLDQDALDWLRTNFYKTELELGRCLRLPQEGPCECELYLTCAKFVTTPQYAPRLRERLCTEGQLITDAQQRGWDREADRHQRTADRLRGLLDELGEPHETPPADV